MNVYMSQDSIHTLFHFPGILSFEQYLPSVLKKNTKRAYFFRKISLFLIKFVQWMMKNRLEEISDLIELKPKAYELEGQKDTHC